MGILLLAALIGVPLIEIGLFIEVGGYIGLWPTLALVVARRRLVPTKLTPPAQGQTYYGNRRVTAGPHHRITV